MRTAADIGMAGGAIALALVKYLIYNGDLSPTQAKAIMTDAQKGLTDFPDSVEAARVIRDIYERIDKAEENFL